VIKVGRERFMAPEALFCPGFIDVDGVGIAEALFNTIQVLDQHTHTHTSNFNSFFPFFPYNRNKYLFYDVFFY
jgi:hypothetical protein